jgi:ubiquinone/menaquinone biosynthesis C-methylase UbiE
MKSVWNTTSEAAKYSAKRPEHPVAIVDNVLAFLKKKYTGPMSMALDVGCGTGRSTCNLFGKFDNILGVDLSAAMIEQAKKDFSADSVQFKVSGAEKLPVEDCSVQTVLVGRAIHYFDQKNFFQEANRILVPGGVLAYYSVHFPTVFIENDEGKSKKINDIFWEYMDTYLEKYWTRNAFDGQLIGARNRRNYYVSTKHPFAETEVDETVSYDREVTIADLARELDTYSAAVKHREVNGDKAADDMVEEFVTRVKKALGTETDQQKVMARNSFFTVMARK